MLIVLAASAQPAGAGPSRRPERVNVIMVGDRLVDVTYNLGVVPVAMSLRCSLWPMCDRLNNCSQVIGCPGCVRKKQARPILDAAARFGVKRVIVEKHPRFCDYMPQNQPEKVVPFLEGKGLTIEFVDFGAGLDSAVRQTAALLQREAKAAGLLNAYSKNLAAAKEPLPKAASGRKVLILNGTYQPTSGKIMLRVEAPGGYADRFLLAPTGCVNVGGAFAAEARQPSKGHYLVRKSKSGPVLDPLAAAAPDVIVMTGDAFAVQKALADAVRQSPALAAVPALKNHEVYSLPGYVDSSVMEYPDVLRLWAGALLPQYSPKSK